MKKGFKITEITAFIATDDDGTEGLVGAQMKDGSWMPFIAADPDRVASLKEYSRIIAKETNKRIVLAKFEVRKNVEVIKP